MADAAIGIGAIGVEISNGLDSASLLAAALDSFGGLGGGLFGAGPVESAASDKMGGNKSDEAGGKSGSGGSGGCGAAAARSRCTAAASGSCLRRLGARESVSGASCMSNEVADEVTDGAADGGPSCDEMDIRGTCEAKLDLLPPTVHTVWTSRAYCSARSRILLHAIAMIWLVCAIAYMRTKEEQEVRKGKEMAKEKNIYIPKTTKGHVHGNGCGEV